MKVAHSLLTRREFMAAAGAIGATAVWAGNKASASHPSWSEHREGFAEGVASGDPTSDSVLLWTRVSNAGQAARVRLFIEVAADSAFEKLVASAEAQALAESDHTCRVLVGGLKPAHTYWYRFIDEKGRGSRIGRTRTAPAPGEDRGARFAFVSCQNVCEGAQNAYRRMIFEDERAAPADQLDFVLHLGDFIYEVVEYPEDRPGGRRYARRVRDRVRYPHGEKVMTYHIPTTVEDYRTAYRAYLQDPDLQDARARWPFIAMWDNHEFSWLGWQSIQQFQGENRPAQTRKVAANQAWFEYQPARVAKAGGSSLERFEAPHVKDVAVSTFDEHGLGTEPNNRAAIESLTGYRALRWGRHMDLFITDQHSYRSEEPCARQEAAPLTADDFPELMAEENVAALDAGRAHRGGKPPDTLTFGDVHVTNFRKSDPPQTILGAHQKEWFLRELRSSRATWKVWGNSQGTLDWRVDPQNIPEGVGKRWGGRGYAVFGGGGDYGTAYLERAEIYDAVRDAKITGFVTVSGDRHSFWAGLAAKALPSEQFEPVGAAFVTGSLSAVGLAEAYEYSFPKDHPLRALYVADVGGTQQPAINLLMHHGVRSCLEYSRTGDLKKALAASNPDVAPHLSFLDMGGHGYAVVRIAAAAMECEFVCIPRPIERNEAPDGGPLRYRVVHRVPLWSAGTVPKMEQRVVEGDPGLSV
jgi:alkaline phosphatase D